MKSYTEIANEWGAEVNIAAANDDDEIEIFGATGNYYIYVESWNNDRDDIDSEIYNKLTLSDEEVDEEDGSRGTVSWPNTWNIFVTDPDEGANPDVEILSVQYNTDSDHVYFRIQTEAAADLDDSTFGVLLDDVSNTDQTYEAVCATGETGGGVKKPYIYRWSEGEWGDSSSQGTTHYRLNHGGNNGVDLACDKDDFGFTFSLGTDKGTGIATDSQVDAFDGIWSEQNSPSSNVDDVTASGAIPEFQTLLMPIASVMLIVGNRIRNKRKNQH